MAEPPGLAAAPSVREAIVTGTAALTGISDSPRLDAELLLAEALGADRTRLVLDAGRTLDEPERARWTELLDRRRTGEPVAQLLGRRGFRHLELTVDRRVLVPRPETEGLVEVGLELAPGASVLDVGTGSGAVALALRQERPDLRVAGVELSPEALAVAEANRERLRLDVSFRLGDLLDGWTEPVDAVLANLPYVEDGAPLAPDVRDFEPSMALFGGPDGLDVIRRLVDQLAVRSWPALVGLEIGATQGSAVAGLLRAAGFTGVNVRPDLAGHDRIVVARRAPGESGRSAGAERFAESGAPAEHAAPAESGASGTASP